LNLVTHEVPPPLLLQPSPGTSGRAQNHLWILFPDLLKLNNQTSMSTIISALEWRYATKQFDPERTASNTDIETIKKAINLTATSFGLQPFRVMVITDQATKEKLRAAAYNQAQLSTASHIFVLAAKQDMSPEYIDAFMNMLAEQRGIPFESVKGYADYIKGSVAGQDADSIRDWNRRQAYIALGTLLATAGELKIDTSPMEGFDAAQFDEILGLKAKGLSAAVIVPLGYRLKEDQTQHYAKVRFPLEEMFV
jgi:nitroreductase/dihydropteridine reductase